MQFSTYFQAGFAALVAAASLLWTPQANAQTPPAGQLKCHVDSGMGFIVGSSRKVDCIYTPAGPGEHSRPHQQDRHRSRLGEGRPAVGRALAGLTKGPGAVAGNYVGATAEVAAGVGAGAQCTGRRQQGRAEPHQRHRRYRYQSRRWDRRSRSRLCRATLTAILESCRALSARRFHGPRGSCRRRWFPWRGRVRSASARPWRGWRRPSVR